MSYNESLSSNSNYPAMSQAEWDNAPFNEPLEEEYTRPVSVSLSFDCSTLLAGDVDELDIRSSIENKVYNIFKDLKKDSRIYGLSIDELEVLEED